MTSILVFSKFSGDLFPFLDYQIYNDYVKVNIPDKLLCKDYYQEYHKLFDIALFKRKHKSWNSILSNFIDIGEILYARYDYFNIETGIKCDLTIYFKDTSFTVSSTNNNKERAKGLCSRMAVEEFYKNDLIKL